MRRRAERKEGVERRKIIAICTVVALDKMLNPNSLSWIKFCGSNHLIRRGLVVVIPKILEINVIENISYAKSYYTKVIENEVFSIIR